MPNTREREKVRALVSAFNVNNYDFNAVKTNFKLQSRGKKDHIVVSFDKSMDTYQCSRYLDSIKRKIIREFYGIEESNDAEILDTAKLIFDVNSFPFDISDRDWSWDEQHGFKFVTPVDEGVIFNLKSHLASSLEKDIREDMQVSSTTVPFNKEKYLCHSKFDNKGLRKKFESMFLSRMKARYENVPKNPLEVKGNSVYIKDVFNDARFIDSITRRAAWRIGIDLGVGNDVDHSVMLLKDSIINSVYQSTKIIVVGFICASPLNREEASILIPLVLGDRGKRILTSEEALKLNYAFDGAVFCNLYDRTQGELSINKSGGIYGIDFSNPEISHCVITKIIESSVINKDQELAIDPGLRLQALSPAQSPFNSPTHAGLSELRTPLSKRKKDTDSGYDSNSPPKPKDSVAHSPSGVPGPSTELSYMEWESPTRSQDEELGRSPGRGLEEVDMLPLGTRGVPGTSKGFSPSPQLNSIAVSYGVSGPSSLSQSVDAAKNVQAGTNAWSQPIGFLSSPAPSAEPSLWQTSKPSSLKGANESGSAWTSQPIGSWSSPAPSAGLSLWQPSRPSSSKGASERRTSEKPLTEEEKNLFKELLYAFNYSNNNFDLPDTNFIVKNGKIASLIPDSVNVKEYLQEVRDKTKEGYCKDKKEAYDLNEFPFKFLSNCEKNQETTVVANISRGALFNLEKLFIYGYEEKVKIEKIDINIIKEAVKSKKHRLVDLKKKGIEREGGCYGRIRNCEAVTACYPDENALEDIPIIKDKGGYCLDRTFNDWETKLLLKEQQCTKGTSVAKKGKLEDNKDSGISSGEATDAENVSSKAEATTISGYESMDCENTREGSPKRKPEKPLEGSPEKSLRRDSSPLSRLESLSLSSSSHKIGKC